MFVGRLAAFLPTPWPRHPVPPTAAVPVAATRATATPAAHTFTIRRHHWRTHSHAFGGRNAPRAPDEDDDDITAGDTRGGYRTPPAAAPHAFESGIERNHPDAALAAATTRTTPAPGAEQPVLAPTVALPEPVAPLPTAPPASIAATAPVAAAVAAAAAAETMMATLAGATTAAAQSKQIYSSAKGAFEKNPLKMDTLVGGTASLSAWYNNHDGVHAFIRRGNDAYKRSDASEAWRNNAEAVAVIVPNPDVLDRLKEKTPVGYNAEVLDYDVALLCHVVTLLAIGDPDVNYDAILKQARDVAGGTKVEVMQAISKLHTHVIALADAVPDKMQSDRQQRYLSALPAGEAERVLAAARACGVDVTGRTDPAVFARILRDANSTIVREVDKIKEMTQQQPTLLSPAKPSAARAAAPAAAVAAAAAAAPVPDAVSQPPAHPDPSVLSQVSELFTSSMSAITAALFAGKRDEGGGGGVGKGGFGGGSGARAAYGPGKAYTAFAPTANCPMDTPPKSACWRYMVGYPSSDGAEVTSLCAARHPKFDALPDAEKKRHGDKAVEHYRSKPGRLVAFVPAMAALMHITLINGTKAAGPVPAAAAVAAVTTLTDLVPPPAGTEYGIIYAPPDPTVESDLACDVIKFPATASWWTSPTVPAEIVACLHTYANASTTSGAAGTSHVASTASGAAGTSYVASTASGAAGTSSVTSTASGAAGTSSVASTASGAAGTSSVTSAASGTADPSPIGPIPSPPPGRSFAPPMAVFFGSVALRAHLDGMASIPVINRTTLDRLIALNAGNPQRAPYARALVGVGTATPQLAPVYTLSMSSHDGSYACRCDFAVVDNLLVNTVVDILLPLPQPVERSINEFWNIVAEHLPSSDASVLTQPNAVTIASVHSAPI